MTAANQNDRAVQVLTDTAREITDDLRQLLGDRPDAVRTVLLCSVVNAIAEQRIADRSRSMTDLAWEFARELVEAAAEADKASDVG